MDLNINPSKIGKRVRLDVSYINEDKQTLTASTQFSVIKKDAGIYGAEWSGSGFSFTRTDGAVNFLAPDPFINDGNHPGFSPFDNIMPWSGMVREMIDGNEMVKIPKFWYKITTDENRNFRKIQIANYPVEGFAVSPAHRDRGDGEKDFVYIGRYHSDSIYKSVSGEIPVSKITRADARIGSHSLGNNYWQLDISMWITIWFLYLVEFANWDSQACIGYDCGNGSSKQETGSTDLMPYHTGTMQTSRTITGLGVQYRYIEDPWGNVLNWCDGITFNMDDIYCFEKFADYSDDYTSTGATLVGRAPSYGSAILDFGFSSNEDFSWFMHPSSIGVSYKKIGDYYNHREPGVVFSVGGSYYDHKSDWPQHYGLFFINETGMKPSRASNDIGARLQYIP